VMMTGDVDVDALDRNEMWCVAVLVGRLDCWAETTSLKGGLRDANDRRDIVRGL
jgi:hypothetical protein